MNKTFFHVSPLILGAGSVISPGNWGRVINTYKVHHQSALTVKELCFENVRLAHHPEKPSRFLSMFLFPSHPLAFNHLQTNDPTCVVYEVESIDQEAAVFSWRYTVCERLPRPVNSCDSFFYE
ncbi:MAG: hypothetical protein ABI865_04220 [Nitrosospira sp.]